jgi:hypothetical protein
MLSSDFLSKEFACWSRVMESQRVKGSDFSVELVDARWYDFVARTVFLGSSSLETLWTSFGRAPPNLICAYGLKLRLDDFSKKITDFSFLLQLAICWIFQFHLFFWMFHVFFHYLKSCKADYICQMSRVIFWNERGGRRPAGPIPDKSRIEILQFFMGSLA